MSIIVTENIRICCKVKIKLTEHVIFKLLRWYRLQNGHHVWYTKRDDIDNVEGDAHHRSSSFPLRGDAMLLGAVSVP